MNGHVQTSVYISVGVCCYYSTVVTQSNETKKKKLVSETEAAYIG
jgi:hypothetical protein